MKMSFDAECRLTVDDRTAACCLMMLEVYLNANPDVEVLRERQPDGYWKFRFCREHGEKTADPEEDDRK